MQECVVLHPAKFRGGILLRDSEKLSVEFSWKELVARLDPENTRSSKLTLRSARPGDFVGVRKKGDRIVNFLISVRSGNECNVEWLLRKIPDFGDSVREIFRVEQVSWDAQMTESAA